MNGSRDTVVSILTRKHNSKSAITNCNQNNAGGGGRECSEIFERGTVIGRVGECLIAELKLNPGLNGGLAG